MGLSLNIKSITIKVINMSERYQNCVFLLACHLIVADGEINTKEISVLENYFHVDNSKELSIEKQKIFSDDENKKSIDELLLELKEEQLTEEHKKEIIELLSDIAFSDNYISAQEQELIEYIAQCLQVDYKDILSQKSILNEQEIESTRLKLYQKLIGKIQKTVYNNFLNKDSEKNMDNLFGSLGFSTVIEKISDEAIIDLNSVTEIIKKTNEDLVIGKQEIDKLTYPQTSRKEVEQIIDVVQGTKNHFNTMINSSLAENLAILDKKKRNFRYFTIAFMGRTKAGKSTFHKIITQEKNDDIGVGKLRTTRYNRSWYWDKLRIVDTPGIGAPGGDVDTEIAKSIIDEADLICYIVTSDAIQETEFDFFETIKERNKPLYIILNVKSNLTESIRLKRFLRDPHRWRECNGPQSIQGHFDRIRERLDGKYNMDAVKVIPIHLLAAQLAMQEKESNPENYKSLIEGSNIMEFIRSVKKEVYESGSLKKSLSVIDGTAYQIHLFHQQLQSDIVQLKKSTELLKKKNNSLKVFFQSESSKLTSNIDKLFNSTQVELNNYATSFADTNYENKNVGKTWEEDSVVRNKISYLNEQIKTSLNRFNKEVKERIEEISSDIKFIDKISSTVSVQTDTIHNTKSGVRIAGTICAIIFTNLWNPLGWGALGALIGSSIIAAVVGFFTSLFESKGEKIKKAKKKLREQLYENIEENIKTYKKETLDKIHPSISLMNNRLKNLLGTSIDEVEQLIRILEDIQEKCIGKEQNINALISLRILEYVHKEPFAVKKLSQLQEKEIRQMFPVERDWEKQTLTYHYTTNCSDTEKKEAEKATQMNIIFK
jgi:putative GTPase